jgi:hypothetical protein
MNKTKESNQWLLRRVGVGFGDLGTWGFGDIETRGFGDWWDYDLS